MSKRLERDVYNMACNVLASYGRRKAKRDYEINRIYSLAAPQSKLTAKYGGNAVDSRVYTAKEIADMILAYEKTFNARVVNAVEQAKIVLIMKYGDGRADKLFRAIYLNTYNRREYPYHVLDRTLGVHYCKRQFVNIKNEFIDIIADLMELK